ncbi:hypothetical protein IAG41_21360 [Sphingomonas sp. JC676]|uniref:hypothetical protein n=1 Tax=Sphingomonas sp. JC676 TaxID=2768065 RepID=UPI00165811D9|nr:hypothetical protein [Sphingomonas sp. JC676]MBC9034948.1 hypothetical protein [Sphingomonas sp. JC676]
MPLVRIVAFAALILAFGLAVVLVFVRDIDDGGQLFLLLIAAVNAGLVAAFARARRSRVASTGLLLVMVGVVAMLAAETSPYWVEGILPRGDDIEDIFARFNTALSALLVPFWGGSFALLIGWVLWIASRIAARRAARVVSEPRLPI